MNSSEIIGCKENIQPLRHGRDATKLSAGLQAQTDAEADRALQAQRQEYETLLRDDSIEDPLSVWYEYVYWLEQSFPSHVHKSKINVILRKCIAKFKQSECYKNDERFVKLCIKYATACDNTTEVLSQVYNSGIGKKCAILYIAWAEQYAVVENFTRASKIYEKGIKYLAQPIDKLKDAQKKLDAFLVKRVLDSKEVYEPNVEIYETGPVRQAYNKIKPLSVRGTDVVPNVRVGENVAPVGKFKSAVQPVQKSIEPFAIFKDEIEDDIEVQPTAKLKIKSQSAMTKENRKKPGVWTNHGTTNVPFAIPPTPLPFQVHVDEDENAPAATISAPMTTALQPKQRDEFNDDFADTPLFIYEPCDPKVRRMYRKEQVYAGGLEFQFEELRAMQYRRRMVQSKPTIVNSVRKECPESSIAISNRKENKAEIAEKMVTPVTTKRTESMKPDTEAPRSEAQGSSSQPLIADFERLKVRTGEEARSARRRIALGGEGSERKSHSARKSNFGGVVRRTLVLDENPGATRDPPSDSFINQTIHTKEALDEMQQLWFAAKPATPPRLSAVKPAASAAPAFQIFVDESCLEKSQAEVEPKIACVPKGGNGLRPSEHLVPPVLPPNVDETDKENVAPINYAGATGKSQRPVTGILTPAENVPFEPLVEEEENEDECESLPEMPCNATAITETWNFTQAFAFPRIQHASTPNVRRSLYKPDRHEEEDSFEEEVKDEAPMNLKVAAPAPPPPPPACETRDLSQKETLNEVRKAQVRVAMPEQRTLGDKNLSIIVETSREYKSSSSGSGTSNYCSKLLPFTPGPSAESHKMTSCSHNDTKKTPFAYKTQSTYGYEASAELSCTNTKPIEISSKRETERLIVCKDASATSYETQNANKTPAIPSNVHEDWKEVVRKNDNVREAVAPRGKTITPGFNFDNIREKSLVADVDPFDTKLIDSFLDRMQFGTKVHVTGCNFVYESRLPPLKVHSKVTLGKCTFELKKLLGEGAYAKVFKAQNTATGDVKVLKYQKPAFPWEFYIAREVRSRCKNPQQLAYFMHIEEGYFFDNASLLMSSPVEYGDLLSAINLFKKNQGKPMSDYLALYFSVQLLDIIETLHKMLIIHGDLKPDNLLIKKVNGDLCLELIDFGRAIDMTQFPEGTTFTCVVNTQMFTCIEMQTGRPWTYQLDLYGVAACIHCLLFGDYMSVQKKGDSWTISRNIPRYLAKSGWKEVFHALLNIPSCKEMPNLSQLRVNLTEKLQAYGQQPDLIKLKNFLENH